MNDFVNYQNPGIELPPGCKDLIDVLRRKAKSRLPAVTRGCQVLGRLSDVPRYVSTLVNSWSARSSLTISPTNERLPIVLYRSEGGGVSTLVLVNSDTKREEGIRQYPLPADASQASQIVTDLLRGVYGCTESSELRFRYYQVV